MAKRVLEAYLQNGLLPLDGNDAWFDYITAAADQLSGYIARNPHELAAFLYSAVDSKSRPEDFARAKAIEAIQEVWKTYASVTFSSPDQILRGIILDALVKNSQRDSNIKLAITLLLSSLLPNLSLGAEAEVWGGILGDLRASVEIEAERQWSVPANISLPEMDSLDAEIMPATIKGKEVDRDELSTALWKAFSSIDAAGEATGGNSHAPNAGQNWANQAVPLLVDAVSDSLGSVSGTRKITFRATDMVSSIAAWVSDYIESSAQTLAQATLGVELRSRLLWWKEAEISPSSHDEYCELPLLLAPLLMAFDYKEMLPTLAPASVVAFLRQTVRSVCDCSVENSLGEYLQAASTAGSLCSYKSTLDLDESMLRPLAALMLEGYFESKDIEQKTVFDISTSLSADKVAVLVFRELQAMEAISNTAPFDEEPVVDVGDEPQEGDED